MIHAFIQKRRAFNVKVQEELWFYGVTVIWSESGRRKAQEKKNVQMPSPGLLNLRGSKGKRDVSAPTVIWWRPTFSCASL